MVFGKLSSPKYLIVGLDAGITVGYSILDLDGNLVFCGSKKELSDEKILSTICAFGTPIVIASDTNPPSSFVSKVASRLNAKLFFPNSSLSQNEKRMIAKDISDPHIRDSFAAETKAYRKYQNRLRSIESSSAQNKQELKMLLISGKRISDFIVENTIQ